MRKKIYEGSSVGRYIRPSDRPTVRWPTLPLSGLQGATHERRRPCVDGPVYFVPPSLWPSLHSLVRTPVIEELIGVVYSVRRTAWEKPSFNPAYQDHDHDHHDRLS